MNLYLFVRQTHIVSMMRSIVLAVAAEPLLMTAPHLGQVERLVQRYRHANLLLKAADLTRFLGFLAGIVLVIMGGWSPLAPWLVAAFSLFVLTDVIGRIGTRPWQHQLQGMLAQANGAVVGDLQGRLAQPRAMFARWFILALLLVIMVLMRQKPSFGL